MLLCACYAVCGTDTVTPPMLLRACYAVCGTNTVTFPMLLHACHAVSGTCIDNRARMPTCLLCDIRY
eukprot:3461214-Rhodomonas_salina.2